LCLGILDFAIGVWALIPSFRVFGVRIHAVQSQEAVAAIAGWVRERSSPRFVVVADMHVVAEARHDRSYRSVIDAADLVVADGTPIMLAGRLARHPMRRRVYGPELMLRVLEQTAPLGVRHFFYGGAEGVADDLAGRMSARFPGLVVAGTHAPPFAPFSPDEDPAVVEKIRAARPDVLWVGLGAPKQERWMWTRRAALGVPVMVGVGAAFDFHTGRVPQAPAWMREHGLEWLFRLRSEPRRLWRRYIIQGGEFALAALLELFTGRFRLKTKCE
jgi:N-acetylglucosaminyldiphosphoundecaprenol N-acetyl-beta-D-mannosaminyltransferase